VVLTSGAHFLGRPCREHRDGLCFGVDGAYSPRHGARTAAAHPAQGAAVGGDFRTRACQLGSGVLADGKEHGADLAASLRRTYLLHTLHTYLLRVDGKWVVKGKKIKIKIKHYSDAERGKGGGT